MKCYCTELLRKIRGHCTFPLLHKPVESFNFEGYLEPGIHFVSQMFLQKEVNQRLLFILKTPHGPSAHICSPVGPPQAGLQDWAKPGSPASPEGPRLQESTGQAQGLHWCRSGAREGGWRLASWGGTSEGSRVCPAHLTQACLAASSPTITVSAPWWLVLITVRIKWP